jgi:hypothetical protein
MDVSAIVSARRCGARLCRGVSIAVALLASASSAAGAGPELWRVADLEAGAAGTAKTVFRGTAIDSFAVEIVSVVHDIAPGRDMILARATDERMAHLGIAQGMSGSPVYVNGKLLGAVSSTWSFTKEPLFGITPAEQMAAEVAANAERLEPGVPRLRSGSTNPSGFESSAPGFQPLGAPLVLSGFDPRLVAVAGDLFRPWGFMVASGGSAGSSELGGAIEAGATLGVRLAGGDANMTAIGTVTWIDGDRVYGWGHPFFQTGDVEFPLVSGYVHAIIPNQAISFKLGSGATTVGTITSDLRSGVFGRLGVEPKLTKFALRIVREDGEESYEYDLVRSPQLTPTLVGLTAANSILAKHGSFAEETVHFRQRLVLDDGRETTVVTTFAGDQTLEQVVGVLSDATRAIANNPFEDVAFDRIEGEVRYESGIRVGYLTTVAVERPQLEPGDEIRGTYTIRDYRGDVSRHSFRVPLADDAREGRYLLLLGDARTAEEFEAERDPRSFAPKSLDEYLERIARIRRTDELHVHLYRASSGVLIDGRPLADLPPSMLSVLRSATRSGVEENLPAEIVWEGRIPVDRVLQGGHTLLLEVRKEKR